MNNKIAKWIWCYGEFEIYHHQILSCRRQEKGCDYPCMWYLASPEKSMVFRTVFHAMTDTVIHVVTHSKGMVRCAGLWPVNTDIPVPAGTHDIVVELYDLEKFPSMFLDSEYLVSDENWECSACDRGTLPVGCVPAYYDKNDDPSVFPFRYEFLEPKEITTVDNGILYDFGRETFAVIHVDGMQPRDTVHLVYGESEEEAMDEANAIIREKITVNDAPVRPARAFRYIFVSSEQGNGISLRAEYEYLPIEDKAEFSCDDPLISTIWDLSSYTFHLNSREFYLDGIKRDRWVWSGDAYQSFMINRYLYADEEITKRTIIALLGKPPYRSHINHINDYSCYLIMAVRDYLYETGDTEFVRRIYPKVKDLYAFITNRLDENGYVIGRENDWVFIDWGVLDKDGPACVEQILLWQVYLAMSFFADVFGEEDIYREKASELKASILRDYWCAEKGAFMDSFTSGKQFTSRQTNVFAVLFELADEEQTRGIIANVFENEELPAITTPYFKLYELLALCKTGFAEKAQAYIAEYWGGMVKLGATTVWEAFDPTVEGARHYEMYGSKYGKSLCHAWGSGPILLLGKYVCGIAPTSFGTETFVVRPTPGIYREFSALFPIGKGTVKIDFDGTHYKVIADRDGGIFIKDGQEYPLIKNTMLEL